VKEGHVTVEGIRKAWEGYVKMKTSKLKGIEDGKRRLHGIERKRIS
jgi:hypothetical protein